MVTYLIPNFHVSLLEPPEMLTQVFKEYATDLRLNTMFYHYSKKQTNDTRLIHATEMFEELH